MEFRLLGPLEASDGDRRVDLGGPTQRALLAILLLRANEVVSVERLVDELWTEEPPATAVKTLQAHVSRLRRSLDPSGDGRPGRLETRGQGYVLHVHPGELDVQRFQALLEDARARMARADPRGAVQGLGEALALWRGPPLADLRRGSFARSDIARLDELRLAAIEERIEADLALGRHAAVVPELEHLAAEHPLRERLRGQLMLALYRCDRQAEALSVYQQGRQALAQDLGLQPSEGLRRLERQILEQDPALAAPSPPPPATPAPAAPRRPGRPRPATLVATAIALSIGVLAIGLATGDDAVEPPEPAAARGAAVHDPRTGRLLTVIPLGSGPENVAAGAGSVWVLDAHDATISRIDPVRRRRERTFAIAEKPTDLAVGAGALWVGNAFRRSSFASTNFPRSVSRVDPETGAVDAKIDLPHRGASPYFQGGGYSEQHIAATDDAVWVVNPDASISRIDPATNRRVAVVRDVQASSVAAGGAGVWAVEPSGLVEIDARANEVARRIDVAAQSLTTLAVGPDTVWAADPMGGSVWRLDASASPVLRQIPLEVGVAWLALSDRGVWVTNPVSGELRLIDPGTNRSRVVSRVASPQHVAVGEGAVWVTSLGRPAPGEALPDTCGPPMSGGALTGRLRVVSDLPLQGGTRAHARAMVDAIRLVLERRDYRAGRHRIAYHSCDDSTPQAAGTDIFRCFSNAKAYARAVDVVGVIGPFHSFCAGVEIPIANQAPQGPLAVIGPTTTFTGLTRPYRGMAGSDLTRLYPEGERNFVRVVAGDHLTAVAMVKGAKELGRRRVFVLSDAEDPYMAAFAAGMRSAARKLRVELAGTGTWDPSARRFDRLARAVAGARPEAVLLAGAAPRHAGALIRALRRELGPRPALVANDGFADFEDLTAKAGGAAQGMYVAQAGTAGPELPRPGRRFLRHLRAARGAVPAEDFAVQAAQAAEILLDAIARSDGSRASVNRELRRTRVEGGLLGDVAFDPNGDLARGAITLYRVDGRRAAPARVITVDAHEAE